MSTGKSLAAADIARRPAGQVQYLSGQYRLIGRNGASGTLLRAAVTVLFAMLVGCGSGGGGGTSPSLLGSGAPTSDWMATFSDSTPISLLGIPGTHDTSTYGQGDLAYGGFVKTQDKQIDDQLNHGIRFLDIRGRLYQNSLTIHHGPIFLGLSFQDVIDTCKQFLRQHPTETILLNLGDEYEHGDSTLSYQQVFLNYYYANQYLDDNHTQELWYLGTSIPTLGSVRGKIVLMRAFALDHSGDALGINLPGGQNSAYYSQQFSTNPDQTVYIENLWTPDNCDGASAVKENAIGPNIQRKELDLSPNHLYMTFTSATGAWSIFCYKTPRGFANDINPWFLQVVQAKYGAVGIVIMDFPGDDIIGRIIDSNNYHYP